MPFGIVSTGPLRAAGGGDRAGDLLAHADPDRGLVEVSIEFRTLKGVANTLDEIDPRVGQSGESAPVEVTPVHPRKEEHVAVRRLPGLGEDPGGRGPEPSPFASQQLVRRHLTERDPGLEALHSPNVIEVVGVLDVAAGKPRVVAVEPDPSRHRPHHPATNSTWRRSWCTLDPSGFIRFSSVRPYFRCRIRSATRSQSEGR